MNILLLEVNPFVKAHIPISIGYIGAFLKRKGFNVKILNITEETNLSILSLYNFITEFKPGLVGISTYQRNILYVLGLSKFIKSIDPSIKIILGGSQTTFMPAHALRYMPVDYICRGEGEFAALSVAQAIEGGDPFSNLSGVAYKLGEDISEGKPACFYEDLDLYPSPHLDEIFDYRNIEEAILLSSRGCPFNCLFCYTPHAFHHKVRFHSAKRVVEEMKYLVRRGIDRFYFADPNFTINKPRTHELLDGIIKSGLKVRIACETRADLVDDELLEKMKRAGVEIIAYGLETASEKVLRIINKRISVESIERAIYLTKKHGIKVKLFAVYALPGETFEDAMETLRFMERHNVEIQGAQQMKIYFGSEIERNYQEYGIRPLDERRPPYISIGDRYETDSMPYKEIQMIRSICYHRALEREKITSW